MVYEGWGQRHGWSGMEKQLPRRVYMPCLYFYSVNIYSEKEIFIRLLLCARHWSRQRDTVVKTNNIPAPMELTL